MLELLPEPSPPCIATLSGEAKYEAMPCSSPLAVEPSSHISKKKAIMAVTKSAYAIFQAPPWAAWPPFLMRLMMMGWSFFSAMAPDPAYFLPLTWFSSSEKLGRSPENSTLRPNSIAVAGL